MAVGGMGEDRGVSHTYQGDCELISTLEREKEREGERKGGESEKK